jgi:hypothetical protein
MVVMLHFLFEDGKGNNFSSCECCIFEDRNENGEKTVTFIVI